MSAITKHTLFVGYSANEVAVYDFPQGTDGKRWNRKWAVITLPRTYANVSLCRLIAAAPDLLAALRAVSADPTPSNIFSARAAIAKATGAQ